MGVSHSPTELDKGLEGASFLLLEVIRWTGSRQLAVVKGACVASWSRSRMVVMTDLEGIMQLRANSLSDPACQIISCSDTDTGVSVQVDEAWHSVAKREEGVPELSSSLCLARCSHSLRPPLPPSRESSQRCQRHGGASQLPSTSSRNFARKVSQYMEAVQVRPPS